MFGQHYSLQGTVFTIVPPPGPALSIRDSNRYGIGIGTSNGSVRIISSDNLTADCHSNSSGRSKSVSASVSGTGKGIGNGIRAPHEMKRIRTGAGDRVGMVPAAFD